MIYCIIGVRTSSSVVSFAQSKPFTVSRILSSLIEFHKNVSIDDMLSVDVDIDEVDWLVKNKIMDKSYVPPIGDFSYYQFLFYYKLPF